MVVIIQLLCCTFDSKFLGAHYIGKNIVLVIMSRLYSVYFFIWLKWQFFLYRCSQQLAYTCSRRCKLFLPLSLFPSNFVAKAKSQYPSRVTISIGKFTWEFSAYASADDGFWFTAESKWFRPICATSHQSNPVETAIRTTQCSFITSGIKFNCKVFDVIYVLQFLFCVHLSVFYKLTSP